MILVSLTNHISRALAEYSLLLDSRRTERLAGLRTQTFFEFWVFADIRQNALKIIKSPFTGTKIKNKRRNFSFRLQFIFLPVELLTFYHVRQAI